MPTNINRHYNLFLGERVFSLEGYVKYYNIDQPPMVGVEVILKDLVGTLIAQTVTDSNGFYYIKLPSKMNYIIEIGIGGYTHPGGLSDDDALVPLIWGMNPTPIELIHFLAMDVDKSGFLNSGDAATISDAWESNTYTILQNYPHVYYFIDNIISTNTPTILDPLTFNILGEHRQDFYFMWAGDATKSKMLS